MAHVVQMSASGLKCGVQNGSPRLLRRTNATHGSRRRVRRRCTSTPSSASPTEDPFAEKVQYEDGIITNFFLRWFTTRMCDQLNEPVPSEITYDSFIEVGRKVLKRGSAEDAQKVVQNVLSSTAPPEAVERFRKWFPPVKWSAELNAWLTTKGFLWLVGECELEETEITTPEGKIEAWNSLVKIKKCRYLESSGCTGMCVNMCKIPTQKFFTEDFGLPVTMNPNFEDLSCEMIFGHVPPPLSEDPAVQQPCFASQCPMGISDSTVPCPKNPKPGKSRIDKSTVLHWRCYKFVLME